MSRFYVCSESRETRCIFTEWSMRLLWKRTGGEIARCIRHGMLIDYEADAASKKELRERLERPKEH